MSYIVAFVTYENSKNEFPVQCFRDDLQPMEDVIVRRGDRELKFAKIQRLEYLNWDCKGRIECTVDEISHDENGEIVLPKSSPINLGVCTHYAFIKKIKLRGWVPIRSSRRQYFNVFGCVNSSSIAYIFFRKNGIDIHVIPRNDSVMLKAHSLHDSSFREGMFVDHFLAHTTFNLFEGVLRFSDSFISDEGNLDRYFISQGSSDKRTKELKNKKIIKDSYDDFGDLGSYPSDMNVFGYHD
jgi:hypothetical protein